MKSPRQSPRRCFFWMRDEFLPATDCTPAQASVLLQLAGYANPDGTSIRPGNANLVLVTKYSKSEVKRAIKFWLNHPSGVLVEVSRGLGRGNATVFRIELAADAEQEETAKRVHVEPLSGETIVPKKVQGDPFFDYERVPKRVPERVPGEPPPSYRSTDLHRGHSKRHPTARKPDDDTVRERAEALLMQGQDESQRPYIQRGIDLIYVRARNNGNRPRSPNYYVKAYENLKNSLKDWEVVVWDVEHPSAYDNRQINNALICKAENEAARTGRDFFDVFHELRRHPDWHEKIAAEVGEEGAGHRRVI